MSLTWSRIPVKAHDNSILGYDLVAQGGRWKIVDSATPQGEYGVYMVLLHGKQVGPGKIDKSGASDATFESIKEAKSWVERNRW